MRPDNTNRRKRRWGVALFASATLGAGLIGLGGTTAQAEGVCGVGSTPVSYTAPADAAENFWEFEGKIAAVDQTSYTMTVNGATFTMDQGQLIKTQSLDQTQGNLTLEQLMDPALPTVVGSATVIASGTSAYHTTPEGQQCVTFRASSVYVELAENVLVGALTGVAPDGSSIQIAGSTVELNNDPRWPQTVTDGTGNEISLSEFQGQEGLLVEAEGYFSPSRGALQGTHIGTDAILTTPANGDVVVINRAQWKSNELRVEGAVSPAGTGKTVTVYPAALNGAACDTTRAALGSAAVSSDGAYAYRNRNVAYPATVCVQSNGGGAEDIAVTRN